MVTYKEGSGEEIARLVLLGPRGYVLGLEVSAMVGLTSWIPWIQVLWQFGVRGHG